MAPPALPVAPAAEAPVPTGISAATASKRVAEEDGQPAAKKARATASVSGVKTPKRKVNEGVVAEV